MAQPSVQHVWLGAQTGLLKGEMFNVVRKNATNFSEFQSPGREHEVCAMCWIHLACRNGLVKKFDTGSAGFVSERDCTGGEGTFRGVATWGSSLITCVQSGLLKVWEEDPLNQVALEVGRDVYKMRQNPESPQIVATGGKENNLKIWDLQNPLKAVFKAKNIILWQSPDNAFSTLSHSPLCFSSVVVGNTHGQVAVVDLRRGMVGCCLKGFSLPLVASCGLDRFLRVHDLRNKQLLHKVYLKSRLNCLLLSSKENWEVSPIFISTFDVFLLFLYLTKRNGC
uniref:WD repeat domain 74 n=1 Tax=Eptatretus burgeri TaxID=7764 RepID=A0A8C4R983_EPTBU